MSYQGKPLPKEIREKILKLSKEGLQQTIIATRLGVSQHTVRKVQKEEKEAKDALDRNGTG